MANAIVVGNGNGTMTAVMAAVRGRPADVQNLVMRALQMHCSHEAGHNGLQVSVLDLIRANNPGALVFIPENIQVELSQIFVSPGGSGNGGVTP